jgi:hypothetical protein
MITKDPIRALLAEHKKRLPTNPYCYFELAYTRQTMWMAWLCTNCRDQDPGRKVIASGEGTTPDMACRAALKRLKEPKS